MANHNLCRRPSDNGYFLLVGAMFDRLRHDLQGNASLPRKERKGAIMEAIEFLGTEDFVRWCHVAGANPEAVRESMARDIAPAWLHHLMPA